MPVYNVTDPQTGRKLRLTGDSPPTEQELEQIFSQQPATPSEVTQPQQAPADTKPEGTIFHAIAEPALAVGSSLAGTVYGGLKGLGTAAISGAEEGAKTVESVQQAATEFGAPETQAGERGMETLGDIMATGVDIVRMPLSGITGLVELISGQGKEQAAETIRSVQEKGFGPTVGNRIFDITGDPLLATIGETSPEILGAAIPITKMAKSRSALKTKIAEQIKAGSTDKKLATYMVDGANKVKTDKIAQETIKQGFDQGVVAAVKGASKADKAKLSKMVDTMKKGKENALYAVDNRPSDIAGDSLLDRVKFIKTINRSSGKEIDRISKTLKGKQVDFQQPINNFTDNLDEMGIRIGPDLNPIFRGSDIEGLPGPEAAIKHIVKRLSSGERGVAPDAYELHRMKRFIDEVVTYGKEGEGLSGKTERVLKNLRRDLDTALDNNFPEYNAANTAYAETVGALDSLQDVAGKKMDLFGPNADKAVGTLLRRMMSNAQSRVNLTDAVNDLQVLSTKYGANFVDDVKTQMLFADELDSVFGPVAKTSLAGETAKGFRKAASTVTGQRTAAGVALDVAEAGVEKLRGVNEEAAFKSITELLTRD